MRLLWLACVAALLACASADLELQTLKEDSSTPDVISSTYAIVQDGRVVGVVKHFRSQRGGLLFGRRGGPSDAQPASPAALRLSELFAPQADSLAALRDRLMATRCPYARQMMLARLQMAAAGMASEQPQPLMVRRPFAGGEPADSASEPGFPGTGVVPLTMPANTGAGRSMPEPLAGQDPLETPEDFVDFASAQDQLLGPEGGNEIDPSQAVSVRMGANGRPVLMPRMPAASFDDEAGEEAVNGVEPMMPRLPVEEPMLPMFGAGAGARPLIPRRPAGGDAEPAEPAVHAEPARYFVGDDEAGAVEGREEGPRVTLFTLVWGGAQPMPRHPEHPPHWGPDHPMEHRPAMHRHRHDGPEHPAWPRMVPGGQVVVQTADGTWVSLNDVIRPAPVPPPEMGWHLFDAEGHLNWGMVTFVALAVACTAVWGAMLVQWATYKSAVDNHNAAAFFITRGGSEEEASLKPLLHEGPLKGEAAEKPGVEYASAHVAGAQRTVTVLAYVPLPTSDRQ